MIHKYSMNGLNIVLDVNSGSVHVLDMLAFELLDCFNENAESGAPPFDFMEVKAKFSKKNATRYTEIEISEALSEIEELIAGGMLFANEAAVSIPLKNPVVKALCLHIAHDCNMKCGYCFAEEGEYRGKRSLMSLDVGKAAIDFIIKNSGNRKNLEIDFFGGEPLMNFEVVKGIVEYGKAQEAPHNKKFRFTLTTNGVQLSDEIEEYLNNNMNNVVLSIDGRKEVNDKMRKLAGGQGSYDVIVPKFKKIAESRKQTNYYVRGTFTRENLDFSEDVLHLASLGFKQISVEPVVADKKESYALREEDLPKLLSEYENLAKKMLSLTGKDEFNFFHFNIDLTGGPCIAKRVTGCGAGTEYLAVTPQGELYPCHQFVGIEEYKMGDLTSGVVNGDKYKEFDNCNVYAKEECKSCWCKFYCSGGCAANAYNTHGNILTPYKIGCELQKKRTECAIMIKAKLASASNE